MSKINARILPYEGKYYGTQVEVTKDNKWISTVNFWAAFDGSLPSYRELQDAGITKEEFLNDQIIDIGYGETDRARELIDFGHYESETSLLLAELFVKAVESYEQDQ